MTPRVSRLAATAKNSSSGSPADLHVLAAHVADAEDEGAEGGHDAVLLGADRIAQVIAMLLQRELGRHFDRRPERPVVLAEFRVADHDVAGERILRREKPECPPDVMIVPRGNIGRCGVARRRVMFDTCAPDMIGR